MSNPSLIRELDREAAELLKAIDAIPRGREHDMTGHLDAKRECCKRLAGLMKRWREQGHGPRAAAVTRSSSTVRLVERRRCL